jgi:flagellar capping protein FliD
MHEIGVSTGAAVTTVQQDKVAGRLTFDETKFNKAWDTNRADLEKLLRGDGVTAGSRSGVDALVAPLVEAGGTFDGRITRPRASQDFTESFAASTGGSSARRSSTGVSSRRWRPRFSARSPCRPRCPGSSPG